MQIQPIDIETRTLGERGYSPAHEAWLRVNVGRAVVTADSGSELEPQFAPAIDTGPTLPNIPGRARRLHQILTERYGGCASTRELARNCRFPAAEVESLVSEFSNLIYSVSKLSFPLAEESRAERCRLSSPENREVSDSDPSGRHKAAGLTSRFYGSRKKHPKQARVGRLIASLSNPPAAL